MRATFAAAAVLGTVMLVTTAGAAGKRGEPASLDEARKEHQAATKRLEAELVRAIARAKRTGDQEAVSGLETELSTLRVGFDVRALIGPWRVDYANGVTRTYVFRPDGTVRFAEENKTCRWVARQGVVVLDFGGGPVETVAFEPALKVHHYNPKSSLQSGRPKFSGTGHKLVE